VTDRPYGLYEPPGWDHREPRPLLVWFHAYGARGATSVASFELKAAASAGGFVLAFPDGTLDSRGKRFWNAIDACCDFEHVPIDDVAYAAALIDDVSGKLPIDPRRVYVGGHSNGGFMAQRLACDLSSRLAGIVSVAGSTWRDPSRCQPPARVSVLYIHGDQDRAISPEGGRVHLIGLEPGVDTAEFASDQEVMRMWGAKDACSGQLSPTGKTIDFDSKVPGDETSESEVSGCPPGIGVALWSVKGGSHLPRPSPGAMDAVWSWLSAHSKR
jgi:polyhydroxybutyrate depolymerase